MSVLAFWGVALLTAVHADGCGNECDFWERCQGNIRQTCGDGVDQCVGRRIREEPCEAPNGACAELAGSAFCAQAPLTRCDASVWPRCEGTSLIECSGRTDGYLVATDCAWRGGTCGPDGSGEAACLPGR